MKRFKVRMTVEYVVEYPDDYTVDTVNFHRNESSWCASSALRELKVRGPCICPFTTFKCLEEVTDATIRP